MGRKKKIVIFTFFMFIFVAIYILYFLSNYYDPGNSDTPMFSLPIRPANYANVTGVQRYHPPEHIGFDFRLPNATEIVAPKGGKITDIKLHKMNNNLWIVDVFLRINPIWGMFIAFEPCTYDQNVAIAQKANISAYIHIGQVVLENQTLGWLQPEPGSEFPHIHWTVFKVGAWGLLGNVGFENVNPYHYLAPWAKSVCDGYCSTFYDYTPCG